MTATRNERRTKTGIVLKSSSLKTASVIVKTLKAHKKYKKTMKVSKKYLVDTGKFTVVEGDKVVIMTCQPISKLKRWRVASILNKNKV